MKRNILIVGGSGFVGINILKKINFKKYRVFATYFRSKKFLKTPNVKYIKGDLKNYNFCKRISKSIDTVIMCAAVSSGAMIIQNNPMYHVNDNIIMNMNILKASARNKVKKFIFLSSNTVYPVSKKSMTEKNLNYSLFSKYFNVGWMKIFSEKLCEMYKKNMKILIIRPANLYGPYDKFDPVRSKVIPALIRKFERKKNIEVWGSGKDVKDFIFIEDFVDNLLLILEKINKYNVLNIASSKPVSLRKIIDILKKEYSYKKPKITFNKDKPTMIPFRKISNKKIKRMIKFKLNFTIQEGLKKTIKWYRLNK